MVINFCCDNPCLTSIGYRTCLHIHINHKPLRGLGFFWSQLFSYSRSLLRIGYRWMEIRGLDFKLDTLKTRPLISFYRPWKCWMRECVELLTTANPNPKNIDDSFLLCKVQYQWVYNCGWKYHLKCFFFLSFSWQP